ncbi:rhamnogalacturonan I rhamnosyltransferase 1-like [Salvia divinorum]|uniref:Rhamnogalacturonan I rhamnosyltransferase 1-like n=1 Tax=Salvia divinorum TaxID=28513 RepID=A0ABD1HGA7_SALDI
MCKLKDGDETYENHPYWKVGMNILDGKEVEETVVLPILESLSSLWKVETHLPQREFDLVGAGLKDTGKYTLRHSLNAQR